MKVSGHSFEVATILCQNEDCGGRWLVGPRTSTHCSCHDWAHERPLPVDLTIAGPGERRRS